MEVDQGLFALLLCFSATVFMNHFTALERPELACHCCGESAPFDASYCI